MATSCPIILFDGVCNLCNRSVQFIIRHDRNSVFRFAPLQSEFARNELTKMGKYEIEFDTVILLENGVFRKSTAALKITRHLSGLWPALYAFVIVPRFVRDWIYDRVAKNRYRFFGRQDTCMIPTAELRARFLG